jgi:hypothetical protein
MLGFKTKRCVVKNNYVFRAGCDKFGIPCFGRRGQPMMSLSLGMKAVQAVKRRGDDLRI